MSPRAKRIFMGCVFAVFCVVMLGLSACLGMMAYIAAWVGAERMAVVIFAGALVPAVCLGLVAAVLREEFAKLRRMEAAAHARRLLEERPLIAPGMMRRMGRAP